MTAAKTLAGLAFWRVPDNIETMASWARRTATFSATCAAACWLVAACGKSAGPENTCAGASALSFPSGNNNGYQGGTLANKQLVITFDDGPGSQTLALSAYLKSKGIRATFFVNGHCFGPNVGTYPQCQQSTTATPADFFPQLLADGHLVHNHTQDHYDLTSTTQFPLGAAGDSAIVKELSDTDPLVAPYVTANRFLFRAPYGAWNARDYSVLHASAMDKYYGPIKWDIGGAMTGPKNGSDDAANHYAADWDCWQNIDGYGVKTTKGCATRYLQEIAARGKGIILFHDADYGNVANHNLTSGKGNTIDMVKLILEGNAALGITGILAQGYSFVRVDEVPEIAALLPPIPPPPSDAGPDVAPISDASLDVTLEAAPPPPDSTSSSSSSSSSGGSGVVPHGGPPLPPDPCALTP
jgi:peptidoglycan/xylan/chitin deacetylase (PgdA/CDA1 family)